MTHFILNEGNPKSTQFTGEQKRNTKSRLMILKVNIKARYQDGNGREKDSRKLEMKQ